MSRPRSRRQRRHLFLVQGLGSRPDGIAAPVVEGQEVGQQVLAEGVRRLPRQQRGEVVDADDAQGGTLIEPVDRNGRLVEGGRNGVDRNCACE